MSQMQHPTPEELSSFLDGETNDAESAGIEVHLATCDACSDVLGRLSSASALVRALPRIEPSESAMRAALAAARAPKHRTSHFRSYLRLAVAASTLLGAFVIWKAVDRQESAPMTAALEAPAPMKAKKSTHFGDVRQEAGKAEGSGFVELPPGAEEQAASTPPGASSPKEGLAYDQVVGGKLPGVIGEERKLEAAEGADADKAQELDAIADRAQADAATRDELNVARRASSEQARKNENSAVVAEAEVRSRYAPVPPASALESIAPASVPAAPAPPASALGSVAPARSPAAPATAPAKDGEAAAKEGARYRQDLGADLRAKSDDSASAPTARVATSGPASYAAQESALHDEKAAKPRPPLRCGTPATSGPPRIGPADVGPSRVTLPGWISRLPHLDRSPLVSGDAPVVQVLDTRTDGSIALLSAEGPGASQFLLQRDLRDALRYPVPVQCNGEPMASRLKLRFTPDHDGWKVELLSP